MTDLTFYTNPQSRGRIVRWMLEETGATYATEVLNYEGSMKETSYLAINPMGKVPAIKHGNTVVTECAAICAYLADAFPANNLAPPTSERADYYRWLFFAAGPAEQAITNKSMGFVPKEEQRLMAGYGHFDLMVDTLESAVTNKQFIANNQFTAADVYVGSQIGWGLQFGTLPEREAFVSYTTGLFSRPAYLRGNELDDALVS